VCYSTRMAATTPRPDPAEGAGRPPAELKALVARYDPDIFDVGRGHASVRLQGDGVGMWDVLLRDATATLVAAAPERRADATLSADAATWRAIARDLRSGMQAFRSGRLVVRHDLHLGVGFLAATAARSQGGLRFREVETSIGPISTMEAGAGSAAILLHGLGATKASFLPTLGALADRHRVIAIDLPGFGDSVKPIGAAYDAPFFARSVVALLDALGLETASLVGNSMGGRVALEAGLLHPRVPALLPRAPRSRRVLRRRAHHLPRRAPREGRLLDAAAGALGPQPLRLGAPRRARADRLRPPRPRGAPGRPPPRARLRPRPPARAPAARARRHGEVPGVSGKKSSTRPPPSG
jgi:pimeloyl-ACP methyl ester carboxylesterase